MDKELQDMNEVEKIHETVTEVKEEVASEEVSSEVETAESESVTEKTEKPKVSVDEKIDKTAEFIKKYKIAILCGIIAVVALIIGIVIGGLGGDSSSSDDSSYTQTLEETETTSPVISSTSPTAAPETATVTPEAESPEATVLPEVSESESVVVPVYYADLLDSIVYFEESVDIEMSEADVVSLLNLVLEGSEDTVEVDGVEAIEKISDTVSTNVTKEEMLYMLDEMNASFASISQSVSGDVLTMYVVMNIEITNEQLTEIKSNLDWVTSLAVSALLSNNLTFSYTVQFEMDGDSLTPIELSASTIDIAGVGTSLSESIAGNVLSSYASSDLSTSELFTGYNNMAGEIIADVLNNYGLVTGATSDSLFVTTRTQG